MTVKARELMPGQMIRVEYGDYDNWVNFQIEAIKADERYIYADCRKGSRKETLVMKPEEKVEVLV